MGTIEEIKRLREEGKAEDEIIDELKKYGISAREISDSLSQTKIKEAVADSSVSSTGYRPTYQAGSTKEIIEGMQPSMLGSEKRENYQASSTSAPYPQQDYYQANQQPQEQQQEQQYTNYNQYSSGISSDTIAEISEQVVSEKLSSLKGEFEKIISFRNSIESKIDYIDERLKKIEKVIDRLQLSILQKVGDYVTNVEDMKKELVETQKSFKYLLDNKK